MATVGFTRSITLLNNGILAEVLQNDGLDTPLSSPLPPSAEEENDMNLHTAAELRRQLGFLFLQILSEQSTAEAPLMRQRRLAKFFTAIAIADITHKSRLDEILRVLTETRSQHPDMLKMAQFMDEFLTTKRLEMAEHVFGDLKNPERSRLDIPPDLIEELRKRREKGQAEEVAVAPSVKPNSTAKRPAKPKRNTGK